MIDTLSTTQAINAIVNDQFADWTYRDAEVLVDFFEDLEIQNGQPEELDIVRIRTEWASGCIEDIKKDYSECSDMNNSEAMDWLEGRTVILNPEEARFVYNQEF